MAVARGGSVYDGGVRGVHVVVAGEQRVAGCRGGGERRAADLGRGHGDVDDALRDVAGDEVDELGVARNAALLDELVDVVVAGHGHLVDVGIAVACIALADLVEAGHGGDLVFPGEADGAHEGHNDKHQDDDDSLYGLAHVHVLLSFSTLCAEMGKRSGDRYETYRRRNGDKRMRRAQPLSPHARKHEVEAVAEARQRLILGNAAAERIGVEPADKAPDGIRGLRLV